ncbi:endocellulase [Mycena maculata]|uniref:Endocellulase n=1 Tax=Mycena maculata TaxID=230809 RepID=A0AAD7NV14_9AGAR|nr:endocellulase [Mycena maculata]
MYFSALVTLSCLVSLGTSQIITIQNSCLPAGGYTLCQNLWNIAGAVGSQNSTLMSSSTQTVSWATNYTWADGGNSVKSYANVESINAKGVQLSNISSAPTSWNWNSGSQSSGSQGDVAYDIWFGQASSGRPSTAGSSYEIMIWLSAIGGCGSNKNWEVFSFVSAGGDINSFNADLNAFFTYLVSEQGVAGTQYVQVIQAGTEAAPGSANFVTTSYSVSIASNSSSAVPSSSVLSSSHTSSSASAFF